MPNFLIHVGLPKTATTFLQSTYFPQLKNVQFYGKGGRRYFLDLDSWDSRTRNILISQEELTAQTWSKKNQIKRGATDCVHWADSFEQAIVNLKRIFPSAHVLIMFRRQGDFVVSLWRSHLMMGGQESFTEFYGPGKLFSEADILIGPKLDVIRREFGECATFLSFEDFKQQGVSYLDVFFETHGIFRDPGLKTKRRRNESFNGSKLKLVRQLNRLYGLLPYSLRRPLASLGVKPQILLQRGLPFWRPDEESDIRRMRETINDRLAEDWQEFEKRRFTADARRD